MLTTRGPDGASTCRFRRDCGGAGQRRAGVFRAGARDLRHFDHRGKDHDELNEKWCAADPNVEHIIVLPASLFVDSQQLVCNGSIYKLYRVIENDDPDDFEYFLDPPFGHTVRFGCDGKAGRTMKTIAVNCRPLHPTDADEE